MFFMLVFDAVGSREAPEVHPVGSGTPGSGCPIFRNFECGGCCRSTASRMVPGSTRKGAEASAHRPVAFQSTSGRVARGRLTPRPQCDRGVPGTPGESRLLGIPCVRRQGGWSRRWSVCPSGPWGRGGPSCTRPDTRRAATPAAQKRNTRVHPAALCTREEHLHHSHNTVEHRTHNTVTRAQCSTRAPFRVAQAFLKQPQSQCASRAL